MASLTVEILIILLLIIANGVFAMSEIAVVSARKVRLQQRANKGDTKARIALELANSPNQFLSTVQVGITLIGILAGAFGGATLATKLTGTLNQFPLLAPYSSAIALALVVIFITYLSLIVGELVPKRLALSNPENIASAIALPMQMLAKFGAPVIYLLSASTEFFTGLLGVDSVSEPLVTEEEIKVLIRQGTEAGMFEEAEQSMMERVLRLDDRRISSLMTPRRKIVWLDLEDSPDALRRKTTETFHSRFLVSRGSIDNILGIVQAKDLLARSLAGQPIHLAELLQQPLFVPESTRVLAVLSLFKQTNTPHIALVVDEYGVVQGLITLNDILEAIIGEAPSVDEWEEPQAIQRDDGSWLLDGMLSIDELKDLFALEELPGEHRGIYHTLGGFVITHLGRIPTSSDHFDWGGLRFEVVDMDGNRVDKVLVMPSKGSAIKPILNPPPEA